MRDALLAFKGEAEREDAPPNFMAFPSPEWTMFGAGDYHLVYRRPETALALKRLRAKFARKEWTNKWSEEKIATVMRTAIARAMANSEPELVLDAMIDAVSELDAPAPRQRVFVAIGGVILRQEIRIGSVRLFQMGDAEHEQLITALERVIGAALMQPIHGSAFAEVEVEGDVQRAKQDAAAESEPVIDLLQVVAAIEQPSRIRIVPGGSESPPPPQVVLSADGTEGHYAQNLTAGRRFAVDQGTFDRLREKGFGAVLDALGKPSTQRNDFEKLLLNAIHWIADAERQQQRENRITSYVTALEMFFSVKGGSIVRDVSEGTAYILGGDLPTRKAVRDLVCKLYDRRSEVSHGGQRSAVDEEVAQLKKLVINFVARIGPFAQRFSTKEQFVTWSKDLRLSANYDDHLPVSSSDIDRPQERRRLKTNL